jgi:hypothetical protein
MSHPGSRGAPLGLLGALALGAAFLGAAPAGRAQEEDVVVRRHALFAGTHVFRRILYEDGFEPVEGFEGLKRRPDQAILIVLGDTGPLSLVPGGLEEFVRKGGAALIATDKPLPDVGFDAGVRDQLERTAGVRGVSRQTLGCSAPYPATYRGLHFCPLAQPVPGARVNLFRRPGDGQPPLLVATNVPSMLFRSKEPPETVEELARLPEGVCYFDTREGKKEIPYAPLFAVGGDLGEGRVLVLADHSVFINQMMLPVPPPGDNGNLEFAFNCVSWLRGERRERTRVLFVEDAKVQTQFDVPLRSGRLTPEEMLRALWARRNEIAGAASDALDTWQQEEGADESLWDWLEDHGVSPSRSVKHALIGLSAVLVLYGLYRLGTRLRHHSEKGLPALGAEPAGGPPPVMEQRHLALLRSGNVWEAARELTRQWFATRGAPPSGAPPRVEAAGGWWQRRRARALVGELWRLAHGAVPERVAPGRLRKLLRQLEELDAALGRGSVRLGAGEGRVRAGAGRKPAPQDGGGKPRRSPVTGTGFEDGAT